MKLTHLRMHYITTACTDSAVIRSINTTPMYTCDIIQVGYRVETYTIQNSASSQLNVGKALSYSTPIYKSVGKTGYVTKK